MLIFKDKTLKEAIAKMSCKAIDVIGHVIGKTIMVVIMGVFTVYAKLVGDIPWRAKR